MVDQREAAVRGHGLGKAGAVEAPRLGLFGLHRIVGVAVSVLAPVIERVELVALRGMDPRVLQGARRLHLHQRRRRLVVVEVAEGDPADAEVECLVPAVDAVGLARGAVSVVRNRLETFDRAEHRVGVADHQHVLVVFVAEGPDQPFLLHQPRAEVVVRLVVHDDVFQRRPGTPDVELEIREPHLLEDRAENVLCGPVLKDPAIRGTGQKPEPRHHRHLIARDRAGSAHAPERRDVAVEIPALAGGTGTGNDLGEREIAALRIERDLDALADDLFESDIVPVRQQVEVDAGQLVDVLVGHQGAHQQHILAQRSLDRDVAVVLRQQRPSAGRAVDRVGNRLGRLAQQRQARLSQLHRARGPADEPRAGHARQRASLPRQPGNRAEIAQSARQPATGDVHVSREAHDDSPCLVSGKRIRDYPVLYRLVFPSTCEAHHYIKASSQR